MNTAEPLNAVGDGRNPGGQFAKGNRAGRGNPLNARAQRIRAELLKSASAADVKAICRIMVEKAKGGDLAFIKEWLDRTIGKPLSSDIEARLAALEQLLNERSKP